MLILEYVKNVCFSLTLNLFGLLKVSASLMYINYITYEIAAPEYHDHHSESLVKVSIFCKFKI